MGEGSHLSTQPQPFPNEPPNSEPNVEFEAAVWKKCEDSFNRETEAYERPHDLQGKSIPRIYAHVRLVLPFPDGPRTY
jgi:hypothetical protein